MKDKNRKSVRGERGEEGEGEGEGERLRACMPMHTNTQSDVKICCACVRMFISRRNLDKKSCHLMYFLGNWAPPFFLIRPCHALNIVCHIQNTTVKRYWKIIILK